MQEGLSIHSTRGVADKVRNGQYLKEPSGLPGGQEEGRSTKVNAQSSDLSKLSTF
jgi:hypothetical protein